jgi:hypothetical protein
MGTVIVWSLGFKPQIHQKTKNTNTYIYFNTPLIYFIKNMSTRDGRVVQVVEHWVASMALSSNPSTTTTTTKKKNYFVSKTQNTISHAKHCSLSVWSMLSTIIQHNQKELLLHSQINKCTVRKQKDTINIGRLNNSKKKHKLGTWGLTPIILLGRMRSRGMQFKTISGK